MYRDQESVVRDRVETLQRRMAANDREHGEIMAELAEAGRELQRWVRVPRYAAAPLSTPLSGWWSMWMVLYVYGGAFCVVVGVILLPFWIADWLAPMSTVIGTLEFLLTLATMTAAAIGAFFLWRAAYIMTHPPKDMR